MNKNICLLLAFAILLIQVSASTEVERSDGSGPLRKLASFIGDYINNGVWFGMLTIYNVYCFAVGYTYVFWFNDGGHHFYKCFYSVPAKVKFL